MIAFYFENSNISISTIKSKQKKTDLSRHRRFGGTNFLQMTNHKHLKPLCFMMHCYKLAI
jgi:hypothetical protein